MPSLFKSGAALPLWILCSTLTIIVVAAVAAWLIRSIASQALDKADPKDIPDVLVALSRLLDRFHGFLPRRSEISSRTRRGEQGPTAAAGHSTTDGDQ
jgi:hypothetical protein